MGHYSRLDLERQEEEIRNNPPGYEEEDEYWFFHTLASFNELCEKYGFKSAVNNFSDEFKFNLLQAIIESNGNTRDKNASSS